MTRTYTFVFDPEPEGGFTVTCPALPGLVTYGETLEQSRAMAQDAMDGLIEVMLECGETVPESDAPEAVPRFDRLAHTLRADDEAEPIFEQLSPRIGEKV
jgi:predicted RNase H-like HicB family nuclease